MEQFPMSSKRQERETPFRKWEHFLTNTKKLDIKYGTDFRNMDSNMGKPFIFLLTRKAVKLQNWI
jgi:hypothetical protein